MGASLDGLTEHGDMAVEIKNCCLQDHELAKRGEIPVKYIPQVQHQLACLGADMMHYFSFHKGEGVIVEVPLDSSYVNQLYKAEDQFWKDCIQGFKEPALTEKDYVLKQDEEWKALASQWMELNDQIKTLEQKEEKIRQSLIERAEGMNCRGHGIKLSQSTSKGSIDYSSIPGLCSMDLERYRKSKVVKWRLTKENKGR
jgi:predicted phage-related endonuclease